MEWTEPLDGYCERIDPSFWAEPLNAVSNAAFLIAALVLWLRLGKEPMPLARLMTITLAAIGIGSFLFHTYAQVWAALADTLPILGFILIYIFASNLHFWRWPLWLAASGTLLFIPYAMVLTQFFEALPFFSISAFYWPVPLMIAGYGILLRDRIPDTARGLLTGSAILVLSLIARSLDQTLCMQLPVGTHFLWHALNGIMLGWMIEVYRRHMVAGQNPAASGVVTGRG